MSIMAISLVDIITSNEFNTSQNVFLILSSNGLREEGFEFPNAPPKFTKEQILCWQKALQVTFVVSHPIPFPWPLPCCGTGLFLYARSDLLKPVFI